MLDIENIYRKIHEQDRILSRMVRKKKRHYSKALFNCIYKSISYLSREEQAYIATEFIEPIHVWRVAYYYELRPHHRLNIVLVVEKNIKPKLGIIYNFATIYAYLKEETLIALKNKYMEYGVYVIDEAAIR